MNEPILIQKGAFYCVVYSYLTFGGAYRRREEAFKDSQFATAFYLTKLREYKNN